MANPFRTTVSVKRKTGDYVKGRWTPDADVNATITASVQPITGKELESLNIGREELGKVKVYTDDTLYISDEGNERSGDWIIWQGDYYEAIGEQKNKNNIINHHKYICEYRGIVN